MVAPQYFYSLLFVSTVIISILAVLVWKKTKNPIFPVGIGLVYFWSIYGAWTIVHDRQVGFAVERYTYLYKRMFPILLNADYLTSISYYVLFTVVLEVTVLIGAKYRLRLSNSLVEPIRLSHVTIVLTSLIAFLVSFAIILKPLLYAVHMGVPVYSITRRSEFLSPLYTLHQVLNRVALIPPSIGIMVLISGKRGRYFAAKKSKVAFVSYALIILGMIVFCFVLGNKNELLLTLIISGFFYYVNAQRPRSVIMITVCAFMLGCITMINTLRGERVDNISKTISSDLIVNSLFNSSKSDEKFAAHFSMYGAIHFKIKPTYGTSILSLAASVVPRVFWLNRPGDIYFYYADHVHAEPGQGYTIHHATGWFLNFGVAGIIIGAILWGWIWVTLHNNFCTFYTQKKTRKTWLRIFTVLAPWCFTAGVPALIRSGIEGYKGLFVDSFIFPVLLLTFASFVAKNSAKQQRRFADPQFSQTSRT